MAIKVTAILIEFDYAFIVSSYAFVYNGLCVDNV